MKTKITKAHLAAIFHTSPKNSIPEVLNRTSRITKLATLFTTSKNGSPAEAKHFTDLVFECSALLTEIESMLNEQRAPRKQNND